MGTSSGTKTATKFKKAPDAPKRFKSAFIIFSAEKHKEIKEDLAKQGRSEKTTDIAKLVSEAWREMNPEEKEQWEKKARKDKARYEVEKAMYKGPWKVPANKRTPKDPSAPKRPMSAFLAFSNKRRAALKREHPDATNADLSKMLSKTWKEAPDELRKKYMEEEAELRAQYKVEMAKWRKKVAEEKKAERKEREAMAMQAAEARTKAGSQNPMKNPNAMGGAVASGGGQVNGMQMGGMGGDQSQAMGYNPGNFPVQDRSGQGFGAGAAGLYGNPFALGGGANAGMQFGDLSQFGGFQGGPGGPGGQMQGGGQNMQSGPVGAPGAGGNFMGGNPFAAQALLGGPQSQQQQLLSQLLSQQQFLPNSGMGQRGPLGLYGQGIGSQGIGGQGIPGGGFGMGDMAAQRAMLEAAQGGQSNQGFFGGMGQGMGGADSLGQSMGRSNQMGGGDEGNKNDDDGYGAQYKGFSRPI